VNDDDSLTLTAALKLAGVAATGGLAKQAIQSGRVRVNGAVETRRKRRLHRGDEIEVDGETFVLDLTANDEDEADDVGI
jgi:ribosome-associated protein